MPILNIKFQKWAILTQNSIISEAGQLKNLGLRLDPCLFIGHCRCLGMQETGFKLAWVWAPEFESKLDRSWSLRAKFMFLQALHGKSCLSWEAFRPHLQNKIAIDFWILPCKGLQRAGRAVNRRPAAQLGRGLWARWLVNGPGHAKMLGPRPGLWAHGLF